ncbi:hypothetical protein F4677DRAFT_66734 [Hypoxylon crocopeplum]|nr:hypothetical protein F4677DRAFT_66734 [Hypoxylon crocopeplum]
MDLFAIFACPIPVTITVWPACFNAPSLGWTPPRYLISFRSSRTEEQPISTLVYLRRGKIEARRTADLSSEELFLSLIVVYLVILGIQSGIRIGKEKDEYSTRYRLFGDYSIPGVPHVSPHSRRK